MIHETITKRRLAILLILAVVVIFAGFAWLALNNLPFDQMGRQTPTDTAAARAESDCTQPLAYWRAHPELYPPQVFIGDVAYKERELEALLLNDSQEPAQQLKVQLVVAFLNSQAGADQSLIEPTLFEAYGWLVEHPAGSQVTEAGLAEGRQMILALEDFNLGLAGVPACEGIGAATRTSTSGASQTPPFSPTPSPTVTATASGTLTAIEITATATPTATRSAAPPVVYPTDTEISPTRPPAPTDTPRPADTATSMPTTAPTATFVLPPLPTDTIVPPPLPP
jgi:hypothetical protein